MTKKQYRIRKVAKGLQKFLGMEPYKLRLSFVRPTEFNEIRGALCLIHVDNKNKKLRIYVNEPLSEHWSDKEVFDVMCHELLHKPFWAIEEYFIGALKDLKILDQDVINKIEQKNLRVGHEEIRLLVKALWRVYKAVDIEKL